MCNQVKDAVNMVDPNTIIENPLHPKELHVLSLIKQ